jgi:hypothetical protein
VKLQGDELIRKALKIQDLTGEIREILKKNRCTIEDTLLLIAYIYQDIERAYLRDYPEEDETARRYLAIRFSQAVSSARGIFQEEEETEEGES